MDGGGGGGRRGGKGGGDPNLSFLPKASYHFSLEGGWGEVWKGLLLTVRTHNVWMKAEKYKKEEEVEAEVTNGMSR